MAISLPDISSSELVSVEPINEARRAVNSLGAFYPVEHGTDGTWEWIKYSDGLCECWRNKVKTGVTVKEAWGNIYCHASSAEAFGALPFAFAGTPMFLVTISSNVPGEGAVTATSKGLYVKGGDSKTAPSYYITCPTIQTAKSTVTVSCRAIGMLQSQAS